MTTSLSNAKPGHQRAAALMLLTATVLLIGGIAYSIATGYAADAAGGDLPEWQHTTSWVVFLAGLISFPLALGYWISQQKGATPTTILRRLWPLWVPLGLIIVWRLFLVIYWA